MREKIAPSSSRVFFTDTQEVNALKRSLNLLPAAHQDVFIDCRLCARAVVSIFSYAFCILERQAEHLRVEGVTMYLSLIEVCSVLKIIASCPRGQLFFCTM